MKVDPRAYLAKLKAVHMGKINLACTCRLARVEGNDLKKYTFNEVRELLPKWIDEVTNDEYFRELCLTLDKCECEKKLLEMHNVN